MRTVSIFLDKESIRPGDKLSGQVTIRTNKSFECNRVVLKVLGKEKTVSGSGEYQTTQEKRQISKTFRLLNSSIVPEGVTRLPFAFTLPRGIPPSYEGFNGSIEYTIESVVEVNWALDPRMKKSFNVFQDKPPIIQEHIDIRPLTDSSGSVQVQLESNILRKNQGIIVRFKVNNRKRVRGIQLELRRREEANCQQHSMKKDLVVDNRYYPLSSDDFDTWKEVRFGDGLILIMPFRGDLISVTYHIKTSLDIALGLDPEVIIPIQISDGESDEGPIDEVLDAIENDLDLF